MILPPPIIDVFSVFQPAFTQPTYQKSVRLAVGTVLARGRRTVASALRHVGLHQTSAWATYHHVLNRATWSSLRVSHILLNLILATFCDPGGGVTIAIDETLERRWVSCLLTTSACSARTCRRPCAFVH